METMTAKIIEVAASIASQRLRGLPGSADIHAQVQDEMIVHDIPDGSEDSIFILVSAFLNFADAVRVAERNDQPIIPLLGEAPIPPKKR